MEQITGVRFRELFTRLPKTAVDGDAAIASVRKMAKQQQAARQNLIATLPPAVGSALEINDMESLREVLAQLPQEQAQSIIRMLAAVGAIRMGAQDKATWQM